MAPMTEFQVLMVGVMGFMAQIGGATVVADGLRERHWYIRVSAIVTWISLVRILVLIATHYLGRP